jgi:acylphosphatase
MAIKRAHALVRGRVQNVGVRAFVTRHARELGLTGWVRNLPAGRQVEVEVQGDTLAVDRLLGLLRYGPAGAHVEDIHVDDQPVIVNEASGFQVR